MSENEAKEGKTKPAVAGRVDAIVIHQYQCPDCGHQGSIDTFEPKKLTVIFAGIGDKPCWRIIYGTLDSIWWGTESPFEACAMMMRNWREWTPSYHEKNIFWKQAKKLFDV